VGKYIGVYWDQ